MLDTLINPKTFGALVKIKRKSAKWTQKQLANEMGIHVQYVSDIERGKYLPSNALIKYFTITLDIQLNITAK